MAEAATGSTEGSAALTAPFMLSGSGAYSFDQRRAHVLQQLESGITDKSPKGFIDAPLYELASFVNTLADVYTTSSCSGRITVFEEGKFSKGGTWHVADHGVVTYAEILRAVRTCIRNPVDRLRFEYEGDSSIQEVLPNLRSEETSRPALDAITNAEESSQEADERGHAEVDTTTVGLRTTPALVYFRFEPFILAVEARTLEAASKFLTIAQLAGYRDSGITAAAKRFIINIRGALRLDVPIVANGVPIVDKAYILTLVDLANAKMRKNLEKLERYTAMVREAYQQPSDFYTWIAKERLGVSSASNKVHLATIPELQRIYVAVPRACTKLIKDVLKERELLDRNATITTFPPATMRAVFEAVGQAQAAAATSDDHVAYMLLPILSSATSRLLEAQGLTFPIEKNLMSQILLDIANPKATPAFCLGLGIEDPAAFLNAILHPPKRKGRTGDAEGSLESTTAPATAVDTARKQTESKQKTAPALSDLPVFVIPEPWVLAEIQRSRQGPLAQSSRTAQAHEEKSCTAGDPLTAAARTQGIILKNDKQRVQFAVKELILAHQDPESPVSPEVLELALGALPNKWERLGHCVLLPADSFQHAVWSNVFSPKELARSSPGNDAPNDSRAVVAGFVPAPEALLSGTTVTVAQAAVGKVASAAANLPPSFKRLVVLPSLTPSLVYGCIADALRADCIAIQARIAADLIRSSQATIVWRRSAAMKACTATGCHKDVCFCGVASDGSVPEFEGKSSSKGDKVSRLQMQLAEVREPGACRSSSDCWVIHKESGISYVLDVTKSMFSSGNTTEKARVAKLGKPGEIVLDAYAGIGYFTLPYLKAGVEHVYALELNPYSVTALRRALLINTLPDHKNNSQVKIPAHRRCTIIPGDNRRKEVRLALMGLVDRVNLGLIPSSEDGWQLALTALRNEGGTLHVHMNVETGKEEDWGINYLLPALENKSKVVCEELGDIQAQLARSGSQASVTRGSQQLVIYGDSRMLFSKVTNYDIGQAIECRQRWGFKLEHIEVVKSFAPRIVHVVFDVKVFMKQ